LYVSANNTALDLIKLELDVLQRQNKPLTQNSKNLTAERDLCCHSECSLGNLLTDAMVAAMNGDSTWSGNATKIGIFPALPLRPNVTIPEGTYAKAECFAF
jgi:2',3'-cyclic-nucleotide 2'-phosphodiesterase (5'-nucleotidase family)